MTELDNIIYRYEKREKNISNYYADNTLFERFKNEERESHYEKILYKLFGATLTDCNVLEIGAGDGKNISFFKRIGFPPKNIWANEIMPDRIKKLKNTHPDIHLLEGNALDLYDIGPFDIILQSLVFSSILNQNFRQELAKKIFGLLKPAGTILWYDFVYNNPRNPDVKRITKKEIKFLFPNASICFRRVTLAPPIGRRVGKSYNLLNSLAPFLRTHIIAVIKKRKS